MLTATELREVIEKEDMHEKLSCWATGQDYSPPAERGPREKFARATAGGKDVRDAVAMLTEVRDPAPKRGPEVPLTQDLYEALDRACR